MPMVATGIWKDDGAARFAGENGSNGEADAGRIHVLAYPFE
jgi:hypothetical protein